MIRTIPRLFFVSAIALFLQFAGSSIATVSAYGNEVRATHIVISEYCSATDEYAANQLAYFCQLQTNQYFQIVRQKDDPQSIHNAIVIGKAGRDLTPEESWCDLEDDGFIIRTSGSNLIITGEGDSGTLYGVNRFAELFLGIRWYVPHNSGFIRHSDIDSQLVRKDGDALLFSTIRRKETPSFQVRFIGKNSWSTFNGGNLSPDLDHKGGHSSAHLYQAKSFHTFSVFLSPENYYDSNPEYFPLINGGRRKYAPKFGRKLGMTYGNQICTSNPAVIKEVSKNISKVLDTDKSIRMIALSPNDGLGFCQCDTCRQLDESTTDPLQKYSRRILTFYNQVAGQVAKRHPAVIVLGGAYGPYTAPPRDHSLKAHPNLAIIVAHYSGCQAHGITDPSCPPNQRFAKLLRQWDQISSKLFVYEYLYKVDWFGVQWPVVTSLANNLRFFKKLGIDGVFSQYSGRNQWTNLPGYYAGLKLLWDVDTDLDKLWNDLCHDLYGPLAANHMLRFYQTLETAMTNSSHHFSGNADNIIHILTPDLIHRCNASLGLAKDLATDSNELVRIEKVIKSFDYTTRIYDYMVLKNSMYHAKTISDLKSRHTESRKELDKLIDCLNKKRAQFDGIVDIKGILDNPRGFYLSGESHKLEKAYSSIQNRLQNKAHQARKNPAPATP